MAVPQRGHNPTFYIAELNKTVWEVPRRYQKLTPIGSGAYGQVWYVICYKRYLITQLSRYLQLCTKIICIVLLNVLCSSALDTERNIKVAIKKLARPFQSPIHAKRAYREIRMLKHMNHENVILTVHILLWWLIMWNYCSFAYCSCPMSTVSDVIVNAWINC